MNQVFSFIDNIFLNVPADYRTPAAIFLILLLLWSIYRLVRGYAIYIVLVIILIPGVWPALKIIGLELFKVFGYLIYRL